MGTAMTVLISAAIFGWAGFCVGYCIGKEKGDMK